MNRPSPTFRRIAGTLGCSLLALLSACGGGGDETVGGSEVVAPLITDDGSLAAGDPTARPTDAGATTRSGLYATAAQARMLTDALGDDVLQVNVGCCGADAVAQAVGIAWAEQAARSLANDTPVLVTGSDPRLAAVAADRLAEGGLSRVWVVTR